MSDQLCKEDIDFAPISRNCCECDERPAVGYISVDLGFMTSSIGDGEYCLNCGLEEVNRIRELLPERPEEINQ